MNFQLGLAIKVNAALSTCRRYRYSLSRNVDMFGTKVYAYFGVNPSLADEVRDDNTVRKWIGFTTRFGGQSLIVGNAFALRATDVKQLACAPDPVGPHNAAYLSQIIDQADILIPCWGARAKLPPILHEQLDSLLNRLTNSGKPVMTFGLTKGGDPLHPLMLPYSTELIPYRQ